MNQRRNGKRSRYERQWNEGTRTPGEYKQEGKDLQHYKRAIHIHIITMSWWGPGYDMIRNRHRFDRPSRVFEDSKRNIAACPWWYLFRQDTTYTVHIFHKIIVHTIYHLDQEVSSFLHTTWHRRPNIPTLDRFDLSLSQYIVDIGSPWRHITHPKSIDRVGFLHLKQHWSSVDSVLVLDRHYQHGPVTVTVLTAQSIVCVSHMELIHQLDWTDWWRRRASTSFSLHIHHVGLLILSGYSSRTDVLFLSKSQRAMRLDCVVICCL